MAGFTPVTSAMREGLLRSIDEILAVGEEAKLAVHVSHLKASGKASWGLVEPA